MSDQIGQYRGLANITRVLACMGSQIQKAQFMTSIEPLLLIEFIKHQPNILLQCSDRSGCVTSHLLGCQTERPTNQPTDGHEGSS